MTVGKALASARDGAGLSIAELSERTRIRAVVIERIEADDYDSLAGDLYVRGYLRALAGALGLDPKPLIRQFDAARSAPAGPVSTAAPASTSPRAEPAPAAMATDGPPVILVPAADGPPAEAPVPEAPVPEGPVADAVVADAPVAGGQAGDGPGEAGPGHEPAADDPDATEVLSVAGPSLLAGLPVLVPGISDYPQMDQTVFDLPPVVDEPGYPAGGYPPAGLGGLDEGHAAEGYLPFWADDAVGDDNDLIPFRREAPAPAWPGAPPPRRDARRPTAMPARRPERATRSGYRRPRARGWRTMATMGTLAVVVLGLGGVASAEIVARLSSSGNATAAASVAARPTATAATTIPASPTPSPAPSATARPPAPLRSLPVQSARAFGPDGTADGDNPATATNVIDAQAAQPWQTHWYATAAFGMLKTGTGLLLDMGRRVTLGSVRIRLGAAKGAGLQIQAGDDAGLGQLPVLATARDAGGLVTLRLKEPARVRYVLIWFVTLPPTGSGTYQASVYHAQVLGRP